MRLFPKVEVWLLDKFGDPAPVMSLIVSPGTCLWPVLVLPFMDPSCSAFPAVGAGTPSPAAPTMPVVCLQPSLGACVVELEFPSHWFSQGSTTRAELAYTLEPAAEGPGGCGPGGEEDPKEQALPVGGVELRPADPPQYQEVPLDEAVTLRVPDVPVRPGQVFSATLLLRHNFTASVLTLR